MQQKNTLMAALLGSALAGIFLGLATTRLTPPVKAAPPAAATPTAAPAASPAIADLLSGKTYPLTLKAEQIDSTFHLVALVDQQGQSSLYATRGETVTIGGELCLVCYEVPTTTAAVTHPPQPKAGTVGELIFINMHAVQAIGGRSGIVPIQPGGLDAPIPAAP